MVLLRYLDVCLVAATGPFVLVGAIPAVGYCLGAAAWLLTRAGVAFAHERARRTRDARVRAGLLVGAMMARVWLVALAVILARFEGGKDDGVTAAGLVLAAFTMYLVMSFLLRGSAPTGAARGAQGRPSTS